MVEFCDGHKFRREIFAGLRALGCAGVVIAVDEEDVDPAGLDGGIWANAPIAVTVWGDRPVSSSSSRMAPRRGESSPGSSRPPG
ncbi:MAG: hypothetical protein ACRDZO_23410 [Egibacteraceae bacterium]